jgi:hypothetical protein
VRNGSMKTVLPRMTRPCTVLSAAILVEFSWDTWNWFWIRTVCTPLCPGLWGKAVFYTLVGFQSYFSMSENLKGSDRSEDLGVDGKILVERVWGK